MPFHARSSCRSTGPATTRWGLTPAAASLVSALCSSAALAQQWYVAPAAVVPPTNWLVAIDVSGTATSNHTDFLYGATTFALGSTLQQSGLRLRLEGLGGTYGFEQAPTNGTTTGKQYEGGALVGYQQVWNWGSLGTYIGANVRENTVPSTDGTGSSLGTRVGFKAAVDTYLLPAPAIMMSAYGSYSTAYDAYYARFRAGYAVGSAISGRRSPCSATISTTRLASARISRRCSSVPCRSGYPAAMCGTVPTRTVTTARSNCVPAFKKRGVP
jgi:Cellulose biosynthesis protein BcsS